MAEKTESNSQMPTRTLGRTGVEVSLIGLGGWHLGFKSIDDLEQALNAARTFKPMTEEQVTVLLNKTRKAAARGEFELFKTTSVYDGTASHPEWLGEEPPEVQRVMQT